LDIDTLSQGKVAMPRFHFDVALGSEFIAGEDGRDLDSVDDAEVVAINTAKDPAPRDRGEE
jgi:hypothetical protein